MADDQLRFVPVSRTSPHASARPSPRRRSGSPARDLSPAAEAAEQLRKLLPRQPTKNDLVTPTQAGVHAAGDGVHRSSGDFTPDGGVRAAGRLVSLGYAVARRMLEARQMDLKALAVPEEEWDADAVVKTSRYALKENLRKLIECEWYFKTLQKNVEIKKAREATREGRTVAGSSSAAASVEQEDFVANVKPQFCSDRQAAERLLNGYSGSVVWRHPLMVLLDEDDRRKERGSEMAFSVLKAVEEGTAHISPLEEDDRTRQHLEVVRAAAIGWTKLSRYQRLQSIGAAVKLEDEFGSLVSAEARARVERELADLRVALTADIEKAKPSKSKRKRFPVTEKGEEREKKARQRQKRPVVLRTPSQDE